MYINAMIYTVYSLIYYFPLLEALSASCRGLIFMQD